MKKMNGGLPCLFILLIFGSDVFSQAKNTHIITNVSVLEFRNLMDSLEDEIVIDLRTPEELEKGRIAGAIAVDFFGANFEPSIQALDRNKVYLLYCASGGRSGETADLMAKWGFKKIYNLEQGFNGWVKHKLPITPK